MNAQDFIDLKTKINCTLDNAECIWKEVGPQFLFESKLIKVMFSEQKIETFIPGFPFIEEGKPKTGNFVALVLDVRESTKHLTQAIKAKASLLERVLYETYAINTMGEFVIGRHNGGITEFLGDGFLALFHVEKKDDVKKSKKAAHECLQSLDVVNEILKERYDLPPLVIGIGLAYSKAIITIMGSVNNLHPKVLGKCVYKASKIATGQNEVLYDPDLKYIWPSCKGGKLKFV
jgi:hypothetical protein